MHVAIIMDGNGRWAHQRGLPRIMGHRAGVKRVEEIVRSAPDLGIATLTLYAFSTENWKRPRAEIRGIFKLFRFFLRKKIAELNEEDVRVCFKGRRDRLPASVLEVMDLAQTTTNNNRRLELNLCVDYGGRDEIVRTIKKIALQVRDGTLDAATITGVTISGQSDFTSTSDPDLIIRTGGDLRLSNFLLWHAAYSEFEFTPKFWPDFSTQDLQAALFKFQARDRRFGGALAR